MSVALLASLLVACSTADSRPTPAEPTIGRTPTVVASPSPGAGDFHAWAFSGALDAKARRAPLRDHANTSCVTHVGCEVETKPLPRCTPPGDLPGGVQYLRGTLEHFRGYRMTLAMEGVLECRNAYRGGMGLLSDGVLHPLNGGITCAGDRSDICCPYAPGMKVALVGTVGADPDAAISDYWLCQDGDPPPERTLPSWTDPPKPVLLDVHPLPSFIKGFGLRLERPPIAFWFGDRVALWNPSRDHADMIGARGGPALSCVAVDPAGSRALSIDVKGTGTLWDVAKARAVTTIAGLAPAGFPRRIEPDDSCSNFLARHVAWNAKGPELLVVTASGRTLLFDEKSAARELEPADALEGWFSADGSAVFVSAEPDRELHVWDVHTAQRIPRPAAPISAEFPDGKLGLCTAPAHDGRHTRCEESSLRDPGVPRVLPFGCAMEPSPTGRFVNVMTDCFFGHDSARILRDSDFHPMARVDDVLLTSWAPHDDLLAIHDAHGLHVWSAKGLSLLARPSNDRSERQFLWSPDARAIATSRRLFQLNPRRTVSFGSASSYRDGAWTSDGNQLAVWNLSNLGPAYEGRATLELRVLDARSGCTLLQLDEKTDAPTMRQALMGMTEPRWIPGSDALELPVIGSDSFLRLARPSTGEILWLTMAERAGQIEPVVLSSDGRYAGPESSVREALQREGAPRLQEPPHSAPTLLRDFFAQASRPACGRTGPAPP